MISAPVLQKNRSDLVGRARHVCGEWPDYDAHITGDTVRATLQSANLDRALEALRGQRAQLISVTPIHRTLEDYFLASTREEEKEVVRQ